MAESGLSRQHSNREKRSGDHSAVLQTELGLGEMVQVIMRLLHIDVELRLIPQNAHGKKAQQACWLANLACLLKVPGQWETSKKADSPWGMTAKVVLWAPQACAYTCMCTHAHMHTHVHTHTHTQQSYKPYGNAEAAV